ncbi:MAG: hypothetical protein JWO28_2766 [Hyphomicrobiales bacterium]|nr:hypothetical protein [Hyphomicrobiales bacterium]
MKRPIALPATWVSEGFALRPARARDRTFQRILFAAGRPDAIFIARMPAVQRQAFLDSQFALQDTHYRRFFAGAECHIVTLNGLPVGRVMIEKKASKWRLIDIGLLPEVRSRGLGSALIVAVQAACAAARADALYLQVEVNNRARQLYQRLGFSVAGDIGSHAEMAWTSPDVRGAQLKTAS